jgi:SAM-dependent methyltransferase
MVGVDIDPELIRVAKDKLAWACRREGGRKGHAGRVEFRCEDFVGEGSWRRRREEGGGVEGKEGGKEDGRDAGVEGDEVEKKAQEEEEEEEEENGTKLAEEVDNEESDGREVEGTETYDIITCFSVSKHVHLQGGDAALKRLFHRVHAHLRPGGRFILEPQAWRTYRKRKHASVESQSNYALLQLRPPFKAVLMNEVGFESLEDLGVPTEAPAGYRRPMYCFVKCREEDGARVEGGEEGLGEAVGEGVEEGREGCSSMKTIGQQQGPRHQQRK